MIDVPDDLVVNLSAHSGAAGRAFADALPELAVRFLEEWGLRLDGAAMCGMCALVLPVVREADGRPAALKLQMLDAETAGEPVALRVWGAAGADARAGAAERAVGDPAREAAPVAGPCGDRPTVAGPGLRGARVACLFRLRP